MQAGSNDDAVAALRRLEDAAVEMHTDFRRLRRAIAVQQRHASALLARDPEAAAVGVAVGAVTAPLSHSHFQLETQQRRDLAARHRRVAALLQRKALLGELWERIVVREWYRPAVVEGFFAHTMASLAALERRLDRAAAALRPGRRVRTAAPAALTTLGVTEQLQQPSQSQQQQQQNAGNSTSAAPAAAAGVEQLWVRRRRHLRTVISLSIKVVGEYVEQRDNISIRNEANDDASDDMSLYSVSFTVEDLSEVIQYILTSAAARQQCLGAAFTAVAQTPVFLQALQSSPLLQRHADALRLCNYRSVRPLWCRHAHYAQAVLSLLQEKSRTTSDMLVERRLQRERDEARWHSLRAAVVATLPLHPHDGATARQSADDNTPQTRADAMFDASECPLWLVVNALRQQQAEEDKVVDAAGS
ncbi:hypothetical protein DQ04_07691020 [Trypanosoma grayi]|uniref:hypothetical protein n=1 Tax=Trypanosoma grayi TaxID=71804 RepID=UPI0004F4AEFB|nr:hypothetical protein DQ04_07691020 [Trypanosoma grayi]KEG08222.1 hypothetical protein DQ04_07691020 [Trypanosoma grayi]